MSELTSSAPAATTIFVPFPTTLTIFTTNRATISTITTIQTRTLTTNQTPSDVSAAVASALTEAAAARKFYQDPRFIILISVTGATLLLLLLAAIILCICWRRRKSRAKRKSKHEEKTSKRSSTSPRRPRGSLAGRETPSGRQRNGSSAPRLEGIIESPLSRTFDFEAFGYPGDGNDQSASVTSPSNLGIPARPKRPDSSSMLTALFEGNTVQSPKRSTWDSTLASTSQGLAISGNSAITSPDEKKMRRMTSSPLSEQSWMRGRSVARVNSGEALRNIPEPEAAQFDFELERNSRAYEKSTVGSRNRQMEIWQRPTAPDQPLPPVPLAHFDRTRLSPGHPAITDTSWQNRQDFLRRQSPEPDRIGGARGPMFRSDESEKDMFVGTSRRASSGIFPDFFNPRQK